ncbi:hypothetical protein SKAU_G00346140 [Synaphobranchus kaupii]|uniref:Uncharacterized protein n=1 Tax=Synaphobranchus kaupii TaxID=118154 RepID=A0A9Q1EJI0_SYNKA|nr:hypothetical protein SKAU_G00346140 [Synaphobranchus kaupii]
MSRFELRRRNSELESCVQSGGIASRSVAGPGVAGRHWELIAGRGPECPLSFSAWLDRAASRRCLYNGCRSARRNGVLSPASQAFSNRASISGNQLGREAPTGALQYTGGLASILAFYVSHMKKQAWPRPVLGLSRTCPRPVSCFQRCFFSPTWTTLAVLPPPFLLLPPVEGPAEKKLTHFEKSPRVFLKTPTRAKPVAGPQDPLKGSSKGGGGGCETSEERGDARGVLKQ